MLIGRWRPRSVKGRDTMTPRPKIMCPGCGRICAAVAIDESGDTPRGVDEWFHRPQVHGGRYLPDRKTFEFPCRGVGMTGPLVGAHELEMATKRRLTQKVDREATRLMKELGEFGAWELWRELGNRLGEAGEDEGE